MIRSSYFNGKYLFTVGEDGFLLKCKISQKSDEKNEKSLTNNKRDILNDSTDTDESRKVSKKVVLKKKKF